MDRAGRMAPFAHAGRVPAPSWCGELPGVRASAAAAVRRRGKASGRRLVRRVPCGRVAPAFCYVRQFARRISYVITRRQARGAQGAPLKTYRKFSPAVMVPVGLTV